VADLTSKISSSFLAAQLVFQPLLSTLKARNA
jgi:hypothetical protein